jgi:hypothetical protein
MTAASLRLAVGVGFLFGLALACSRPKEDAPQAASATPASPSTGAPTLPSAPTAPAAPGAGLPTPEDVEDDSAHRITEQNLESELDRLEREIQAE